MDRPVAAVLSGRVQPWRHLVARFGDAWIATSARGGDRPGRPGRPAPFSFEEKREVIVTLFEIPASRVVCVKSPYAPREVLAQVPPEAAYVAAMGDKDHDRLRIGKYFQWFDPDSPLLPYAERGYAYLCPDGGPGVTASDVRAALGDPTRSAADKERWFRAFYPRFDRGVFDLLVERLTPTF